MTRLLCLLTLVVAGGVVWLSMPGPAAPPRADGPADARTESPADAATATGDASRAVVPPVEPPPPAAGGDDKNATTDTFLCGTIRHPDGRAVADAIFRSTIERSGEFRYAQTRSDDAGRFVLPLPRGFDGGARMLRLRGRWSHVAQPWVDAETAIADSYPPGQHEVGTLTVQVLPPLCGGRVVDQGGAPIEGVSVYAMPEQLDIRTMRDRQLPEKFRCETDVQGRFLVYGQIEAPRLHVVAKAGGRHQTAACLAAPQSTELEIVLASAGSLSGSLVVPASVPMSLVALEVRGEPLVGHLGSFAEPVLSTMRPLPAGQALRVVPDERGAFRVDSLRPGQFAVGVRVLGIGDLLLEIDGVGVEAGRECMDPRLQRVALGILGTARLQFTTEHGTPWPSPMCVGVRESGAKAWNSRTTAPDGTLLVPMLSGSFDLLVQQQGVRRQLLDDIRGDRTIVLEPGLPAPLVVQLGDVVPGFVASVRLVSVEIADFPVYESVEVRRSAFAAVAAGGLAELRVPAPGRYVPVVKVAALGGTPDQSMEVHDLLPKEVVVPDGGLREPVAVTLDGRAFYRATRVIQHFFPTAGIR